MLNFKKLDTFFFLSLIVFELGLLLIDLVTKGHCIGYIMWGLVTSMYHYRTSIDVALSVRKFFSE